MTCWVNFGHILRFFGLRRWRRNQFVNKNSQDLSQRFRTLIIIKVAFSVVEKVEEIDRESMLLARRQPLEHEGRLEREVGVGVHEVLLQHVAVPLVLGRDRVLPARERRSALARGGCLEHCECHVSCATHAQMPINYQLTLVGLANLVCDN